MAEGFGRRSLEVDNLRRVLPLFSLAFGLVAAITQPSTTGDLILVAVPVAAWILWPSRRTCRSLPVSPAIVIPVVAQRSGELEPATWPSSVLESGLELELILSASAHAAEVVEGGLT